MPEFGFFVCVCVCEIFDYGFCYILGKPDL